MSKLKDAAEIVPHKTFETDAYKAAGIVVRQLITQQRQELKELDSLLARSFEAQAEPHIAH